MSFDRLVSLITLLVDIGILWILIKEFNFDKIAYEKEQYKKRAKRTAKKESLVPSPLPSSSGKENLEMEPIKRLSIEEGSKGFPTLAMPEVQAICDENRLRDEEGKKT